MAEETTLDGLAGAPKAPKMPLNSKKVSRIEFRGTRNSFLPLQNLKREARNSKKAAQNQLKGAVNSFQVLRNLNQEPRNAFRATRNEFGAALRRFPETPAAFRGGRN